MRTTRRSPYWSSRQAARRGYRFRATRCSTLPKLRRRRRRRKPPPPTSFQTTLSMGPPTNSTEKVWELIHLLEEPVMHRGKSFTHFCMLCLETKSWKESLCRARHTSNAKSHLLSGHKEHALAAEEQQHRLKRTERYTEKLAAKREKRPPDTASPANDDKPTKRQKTW
jgi:hypothetical protein